MPGIARRRSILLLLFLLATASTAYPACAERPADDGIITDIRLRDIDFRKQSLRVWEMASFPKILRVLPRNRGEATVVCESEARELLLCHVKNGESRTFSVLDSSGSPLVESPLSPFSVFGDADHVIIGRAEWKPGKPVDAFAVQFFTYSDGTLTSSRSLHLPEAGFTTHGLVPVTASWCGDERLTLVLQYSERHFDLFRAPEGAHSYFTKYCSLSCDKEAGKYQPIVKPGAFKTSKFTMACSPDGTLHAAWVEERRRSVRIMLSTNNAGSGWSEPKVVVSNRDKAEMTVTRLLLAPSQDRIHFVWGTAEEGTFLCSRQASRFSQPEALDDALQPLDVSTDRDGNVSIVGERSDRILLVRHSDSKPLERRDLLTVSPGNHITQADARFDHEGNIHLAYSVMTGEDTGCYQYRCIPRSAGTSE